MIDFQGPISAVAGPGGLTVNASDFPRLAVFQVTDRWYTHPIDDNVPQKCAFATARPVYYFADQGIWQAMVNAPEETIWHPGGYPLDSVDPARTAPTAMQSSNQFMPKIGIGQWCWCCFDQAAAQWQVLDGFEDIVRVKLTTDWYACGQASGTLLIARGNADLWDGFDTDVTLQLFDPLGIIATDLAAVMGSSSGDSGGGGLYIPAGMCRRREAFRRRQRLGAAPFRHLPLQQLVEQFVVEFVKFQLLQQFLRHALPQRRHLVQRARLRSHEETGAGSRSWLFAMV